MVRIISLVCCILTMGLACSPTPSDKTFGEVEKIEQSGATEESHQHEEYRRNKAHNVKSDHEEAQADERGGLHDVHGNDRVGEHSHGHGYEVHAQRGHGAHQHGHADLAIAWSGTDMSIELQTPAYNILGFEYVPSTAAEKELLARSITTLETEALMVLTPEADCAIVFANVETDLIERWHDVDGAHEEEGKGHSEFEASYTLQCKKPEKLIAIDASRLFEAFPNFVAIQVQWISDRQQSAKTLTAEDSVLAFD